MWKLHCKEAHDFAALAALNRSTFVASHRRYVERLLGLCLKFGSNAVRFAHI
jgi:hypothetical protein